MITITTTEGLQAFCERAAKAPYVTVDTEFLREKTYYPKLCLVQGQANQLTRAVLPEGMLAFEDRILDVDRTGELVELLGL